MATKYSDDLAGIVVGNQLPPSKRLGGRVHVCADSLQVVTADASTSSYWMLCALPSSAVVLSIELAAANDGTITTLTGNIGIYKYFLPPFDPLTMASLILNNNVFASSVSWENVPSFVDHRYENSNLDTSGFALWQMLGLTADPCVQYFIGFDVNSVTGASANYTAAYRISYTDG